MVQLSWSGQRVPAFADMLGCSPRIMRCWLHRLNRTGVIRRLRPCPPRSSRPAGRRAVGTG
ncbi:hypothetical protein [Streptomyces sp. YIM 121038]|uniref:hypothetical protein n=1 Tax=Streptomyces sp. YIM 121038 TaxID=2136401 RepID=UPI0031FE4957